MRSGNYATAMVALLLGAAFAPSAQAKVEHAERVSYYDVTGSRIDGIIAALDAKGPPDDNGERFHARTDARIDWHFALRPIDNGCAITAVTTKLGLIVIMPRLVGAEVELAQEFDGYSARLMAHETGHVDNARKTAAEVDAAIAALPPAATCKEMKEKANAVGHRVFEDGAKRDVAYDHVTDHGRLQGAHFP